MMKLFSSIDSSYSGAYVLDALSPREERRFERAMRRSEGLRDEVMELSDTAALLSSTVEPIMPPPALRASLLEQIAHTPQLQVEPEPVAAVRTTPQRSLLMNRLRELRMVLIPAGMGLAAAAVAVAVILPAQMQSDPNQQAIDTVVQASDNQRVSNTTPMGSTLTVGWSLSEGRAIASMRGGWSLPSTKTYELWVTDSAGNTRSAGLINNSQTDPVLLRGKVVKGDTVRLTVEPAKGSTYPTTKPLLAVKV